MKGKNFKTWDQEAAMQFARIWNSGEKTYVIARQFGVSCRAIHSAATFLRKYGYPIKYRNEIRQKATLRPRPVQGRPLKKDDDTLTPTQKKVLAYIAGDLDISRAEYGRLCAEMWSRGQ